MKFKNHLSLLVLILLAGLSTGVLVFSVSADNSILHIIQLSPNGQGRAYAVAYFPDGKTLAVGSSLGINFYNSSDLQPIRFIPTDAWVRAVAFSPDGSILASGSYDPVVRLWLVRDGTLQKELKGHTGWVRALAFSPNSELLATASDDNTVRLWTIPDGNLLHVFDKGMEGVRAVAFSPDGTVLATGGFDNIIRLWQVSDGTLLRELTGSTGWIRALAFSPNGEWLASGAFDHLVRLWRVTDGELMVTRDEHCSSITGLAFSPDGELLASADVDTTVHLWKMPNLEPYDILTGHTDFVFSVAFSPDGKNVASGVADNTVQVWEVKDEKDLTRLAESTVSAEGTPENCVACHHPRGNYLQNGGLSQPPRVVEVACSTCHLGGTLVLNWCPAFPRSFGPLTPVVVSPETSNKMGVPRGNQELSVVIATVGNGEHFYAPGIIAAMPIAGQVNSAKARPEDIEVHLEIWSGLEKVIDLITHPQPDGYFFFNTFISTGDSVLRMPIEQRTCNACHSENLGDKTFIPPGEFHLLVTAQAPDGMQASDERWISVDQSQSVAVTVHVENEENGHPVSGLQIQTTTRLYEWKGRTFNSVTDTNGNAYLQVEALSEAQTKYIFQVQPTLMDGVLYKSIEPVEVNLSPGATSVPAVTLNVQAATGAISGQVAGLDTPIQIWAITLPDGSAYKDTTSSEGAFAFSDLAVSQYLLIADPQALAEQGLALSGEIVDLSQSLSTQVNLIPQTLEGTTLNGKITDETGASLPFAWVSVGTQIDQTDLASDTYALFGIPTGKATAIISAPGYYSQADVINTQDVATKSISLVRRPETRIIPWGEGTIVFPPETVASLEGQKINFEQGWLWGNGDSGQPLIIKWGNMQITIPGGQFALERLPAQSGWLYVMKGHASIQRAGASDAITIQAGEMVRLNQEQELQQVPYDPVVVGALHINDGISIDPVWEPSLSAKVHNQLARIGIGTAQTVTFITYFMEVLALLVMVILAINWMINKNRKDKTRDQNNSN